MDINQEQIDNKENPAVIAHVEMMQGIIGRLADNSAKCKEWCFALLGILLVFILGNENKAQLDFRICYWILGIFFLLDSFYLGQERAMRKGFRDIMSKLNNGENVYRYLYSPFCKAEHPSGRERFLNQLKGVLWGMISFSTTLPYGVTAVVLIYFSV